jgi:hypothetical protein
MSLVDVVVMGVEAVVVVVVVGVSGGGAVGTRSVGGGSAVVVVGATGSCDQGGAPDSRLLRAPTDGRAAARGVRAPATGPRAGTIPAVPVLDWIDGAAGVSRGRIREAA